MDKALVDTALAESAAPPTAGDDDCSEEATFRAGTLIARRYRLLRRLGAGAMGEVWVGRHEELRTEVAIKLAFHAQGSLQNRVIDRFRFEAQVAAQLAQRSRHVVAVHDAGRHEQVPFLVMELVAGSSLEQLLDRDLTLAPGKVADVLDQLADALHCAHEHAIWHRDIKPANILVEQSDGELHCKLADFGVAKAFDTALDVERPRSTMQGVLVGTPAYMSPEQISGEAPSAASDLWSVAVVAYECLTGQQPFEGRTTGDLMLSICKGLHRPPSACVAAGPVIDAWFARAFARDPSRRFASAKALAAAFRAASESMPRAADDQPVPPTQPLPAGGLRSGEVAAPPMLPLPWQRHRGLFAGVALSLALAAALVMWRSGQPSSAVLAQTTPSSLLIVPSNTPDPSVNDAPRASANASAESAPEQPPRTAPPARSIPNPRIDPHPPSSATLTNPPVSAPPPQPLKPAPAQPPPPGSPTADSPHHDPSDTL